MASPTSDLATNATLALAEQVNEKLTFNIQRCPTCGGWLDNPSYVTTIDACLAMLDAMAGAEWQGWTGRAQKLARTALGHIYGAEWVAEYERQAAARGSAVDGAYCCCGGAS